MRVTKVMAALVGLVFLALTVGAPALAQQVPVNVSGDWTIYATNVNNGETVVKHIQVTQSGNQLSGYFEGPNQSGPIRGEVNGQHIHFSTVTRNILTFRGQIYGDSMLGEYGFEGKHAEWQAVRSGSDSPATGTVYASQPVLAPPTPVSLPQSQSAAQPTTASYSGSNPGPSPAPLSATQLDALVAPIALYPDALVAQVLAASANPDQVADADAWLAQNKDLTGTALTQAVDQQSWDPSVKALTQFPSVLDNLAHNLSWTSSLGQAFSYQQSDVMAAVQTMRAKAQAAGTLQSTSQITVTQPSSNTIVIQPANPQVVYVPQYNPAVVYGTPVAVPLYVPPPVPVASVGLYFGGGVAVGAVVGGGGWGGWGWNAWNVNWGGWGGGGSTIIYNHNTYINNRSWAYNGYHPWGPHGYYGPDGGYHPDPGFRPGVDTHYGPNGAYHPNGYFGPNGAFHHDVPGTNPADQPNGGNNGNHGLIGGNGGVQHEPDGYVNHAGGATGSENNAYYANNGTFHPDANWHPGTNTHYGPNGQYRANGYYGPDGGWHPDVNHAGGATGTENPGYYGKNGRYHPDPGYKPGDDTHNGPNGAYHPNGYYGPDGGWHNDAPGAKTAEQRNDANTVDHGMASSNERRANSGSNQRFRSPMSGDGHSARAESNRGRSSMQHAAMHRPTMHQSAPHGGGGGHRR